tara:strand:+ start:3324 stop:3893 length:570 start_codon:yes stop_codon:yes gene_type:complete
MKKGFHQLEHAVDKSIPYIIALLLVIIIINLFFSDFSELYHTQIQYIDYLIISIFIIDLIFKFIRVRKVPKFIRLYWMDILVVFPFYLFLRAIEEVFYLFRISDALKEGQSILHAGLGLKEITPFEREAGRIIREAEKIGKFSRSSFAIRILRPAARIPRLIKILPYYERTTGKHHAHDKKIKRKKSRK